ncbi:GspH/FimT family pseudopilin [Vibrio vulnificus]|uniref:GspH/FimT family pseudopilin n=1 Tax=Vibrio vulnificus TaxID=672 RepID=UPI001A2890BB|nr:GspH/FimT family pseudopilin [Vibrio vulnificus]MCA3960149.1 GspH/FimT family pseudopilin [Vibrio vulnificus]MDS1772675.1 GspH/FimT family pseudopilin [Vibrio vulnificus]MDS1853215.1 GspH/FimT family pseudopilin [Vibrio vulnificus]MDS1862155.1 GspH/FimT family pseudopilin [Vibrio vulnificus]HAS6321457.1 prepilin-type N-terminal cleavage/methylation domain-containing protein [Vibrio vulnificus]
MHRGFTLLELLITVSVLTALLLFLSPNFSNVTQRTKIVNLANEIHGFLIQAKSEAVLRNQDLWVHLDGLPASDGKWTLTLSTVSTSSAVSTANTLAVFEGYRYRNLWVSNTGSLVSVKFDHVMGNPLEAGNISIKLSETDPNPVKVVIHNRAGRIKLCTVREAKYGFEKC